MSGRRRAAAPAPLSPLDVPAAEAFAIFDIPIGKTQSSEAQPPSQQRVRVFRGAVILRPAPAASLYGAGWFGKGTLSRAGPQFLSQQSTVHVHTSDASAASRSAAHAVVPAEQQQHQQQEKGARKRARSHLGFHRDKRKRGDDTGTQIAANLASREEQEKGAVLMGGDTQTRYNMRRQSSAALDLGAANEALPTNTEELAEWMDRHEVLFLSPEESLYLVLGLTTLAVIDLPSREEKSATGDDSASASAPASAGTARYLTAADIWNSAIIESHFPAAYVAYHHFRSRGLVPKSGLKYGADFVLYSAGGPAAVHAEQAVLLVDRINTSAAEDTSLLPGQQLLWRDVLAINRVSESVRKGLCLCFVAGPFDVRSNVSVATSHELKDLLKQATVTSIRLKRWVPSATREG